MPRAPFSALIFVLFGIAAGLAGIVMTGWAATAHFNLERGFDAVMWAMAHSPVPLEWKPVSVANMMVQDGPVMVIGGLGLFLLLVCYSLLHDARIALLPEGVFVPGKASLAIATREPRVGQPLEGQVRLAKVPKAGALFEVSVECTRRVEDKSESNSHDHTETIHHESKDVQPVQDAQGWFLPFRFELPVTAPASEGRQMYGYRWKVKHWSKSAWITTGSPLDVSVGPASQADMKAFEATLSPADEAEVDALASDLAKLRTPLRPHERAELRALTPAKREEMRQVTASTGKFFFLFVKIVFLVIGSLVAALVVVFTIGRLLNL